jgi:PhnB protein
MSQVPPNGMPTFFAWPLYRDANAAIDWLERVFGFRRLLVVPGEGDTVSHAEMAFGAGAIMVGSIRDGQPPASARFDAPYAYVADVRAQYEKVKAGGAEITHEYEEKHYGGAGFSCRDLEGNEWSFGSYVPEPAFPVYSATAYITVRNGVEAIEFYKRAFGAEESAERYMDDKGRVGHAELSIGPATFYLSDEHPEIGVVGPETVGGRTSSIVLGVADVDATYAQALAAGATSDREPEDAPYGRMAWVVDPYGHRWALNGPVKQ